MTIAELKCMNDFDFEVNMDNSYSGIDNIDEWGTAYVWFKDIGVEYNFCIDNGENCSAIYSMEYNDKTGDMDTDGNSFIHYEIDWNNPNWENILINKLCEALITLHSL